MSPCSKEVGETFSQQAISLRCREPTHRVQEQARSFKVQRTNAQSAQENKSERLAISNSKGELILFML